MPERVNLLSVLVTNATSTVYDGAVSIHRTTEMGARLGATHVQPCTVAPFSSRWLQFYPYLGNEREKWVIKLGRRIQELPRPKLAAPATICLRRPDELLGRARKLRAFPDNLFPATVTATDGLHAVVMDYAPRWEPMKRAAFLDWLRRGGTVHMLQAESGRYPDFRGELSVLNNPERRFRVGAGLVVRHRAFRHDVTEAFLAEAGFTAPTLKTSQEAYMWKPEDTFFHSLKGLVRPEYNWMLIYALLGVYVILVGPLNFIVGRKTRDFRWPLLLFLAAVVGFGWMLSVIGRRGYGESAAVHSISYARPLQADTYDVTQWENAFVLRGGYYTITHPGTHNLYSTCQDYEAVSGLIRSGREGSFRVDIPLYSSCAFLHRGKMKGHDLGLRVLEWQADGGLRRLKLSVGPGFPRDVMEMWVLHADRFYRMARKDGHIEMAAGRGQPLDSFLSEERLQMFRAFYGPTPYGREEAEAEPDEVFKKMVRLLIARAIGGTSAFRYYVETPAQQDRVQLFILAPAPAGFKLAGKRLGRERGCVLYHLDLFKPEETNGSER